MIATSGVLVFLTACLGAAVASNIPVIRYPIPHQSNKNNDGVYKQATAGEFPHHVSIRYQGTHVCSGAIVSSRHILTAAHCATAIPDFNYVVVVTGSVQVNQGQSHAVKQVLYNSNWNQYASGRPHDIALIVLKGPIHFTQYQNRVNLPHASTNPGTNAELTGYGNSANLIRTKVRTISASECHKVFHQYHTVWTSQFCTYSLDKKGYCNEDGGSPLTYNRNTLIGILSWDYECTQSYPVVYTSVFDYLPWINHYINST